MDEKTRKMLETYEELPRPLSSTEFRDLVILAQREDEFTRQEAKRIIIKKYDALIASIVHKRYPTYLAAHKDDLIQEGRIAILKCMHHYSPEKCTPSTFLSKSIVGALYEYIAKTINSSSKHYCSMAIQVSKAIQELTQETGRDTFTDIEISVQANLPLRTVHNTMMSLNAGRSLSFDDETNGLESTMSSDLGNPEKELLANALKDTIDKALSDLSPESVRVVIELTGLNGQRRKDYTELAHILTKETGRNVTQTNVREIYQKAITDLARNRDLAEYLGVKPKKVKRYGTSISRAIFAKPENFYDGEDM